MTVTNYDDAHAEMLKQINLAISNADSGASDIQQRALTNAVIAGVLCQMLYKLPYRKQFTPGGDTVEPILK